MTGKTAKLFALFLLTAFLFNFPFLNIFSKPMMVYGVPALMFYLFIVWIIIIVVIRLTVQNVTIGLPFVQTNPKNKKKKKT